MQWRSALKERTMCGDLVSSVTWFLGFLGVVVMMRVEVSYAHVGLTFPPARKYDLDFLDNVRTKPPCGMPKGLVKTSLVSGSSINVTWHLSYPHQGGYRLELMDAKEKEILDLTPRKGTEDYIRGDPTAQWFHVNLPAGFTCPDCTIRLLREASEWSGKYRFWSCADVSIVEQKDYKELCFGRGRSIAGRCLCYKGFWGHRCQYEDECETDKECSNGNGQCIDLGGTALPRKQCFCNPGFHGEKCTKRNLARLPDSKKPLDLTQHTKRVLSDRMTLFYKVIPAKNPENKELEFVLEIEGTSYGALGWRPASFGKSCQRWPFIANGTVGERQGKSIQLSASTPKKSSDASGEPEPAAESEPEPVAEGEPIAEPDSKTDALKNISTNKKSDGEADAEPKAEGEAEPKAEVEAEPKAEGEAEPKAEGEAEPKAEGEAGPHAEEEPQPHSEPEATTQSAAKSNAGKLKSKLRPKPKSLSDEGQDVNVESSAISVTRSSRKQRSPRPETSNAEPEPEGEANSEPEPEGEPSSEPEPEGEPSASGSSNHEYTPSQLQTHEWTPRNDFHAMDCIDLVMGGARGHLSRILDYYTRDRSTPRLDSFWGGKNDITSATGWEKDKKTTLIFRRKVRSTDGSDHSLDAGEMHVIWARGQEQGDYVHKPKSGLEAEGHMPSIPSFYAPDEIKYHGHGAQRGKTRINFFENAESANKKDEANCEDGWSHPPGCSNDDPKMPCTYAAKWRYIPGIDSVQFTIQTWKAQKWTGIGFGESPTMRNSDAILGWVTAAGRFFIMDTFMPSYVQPVLDATQNIKNESGTYSDGLVTLSFIRPIQTSDLKDVSLDKCRFFIFPIEGGSYDAVSKKIGKHDATPLTSAERVCISRQCRPVKPKIPDEVRYAFDIKLVGGFANNWVPPTKGTSDFDEFSNRLRRDLEVQLKTIEGFNRLRLTDIKKVGAQAVASLELMVKPKSELSEMTRVERALKETISSGRAGLLQVDPSFLELSSPEVLKSAEDVESGEGLFPQLIGTRLWIVIGCVAALIVLALIQALLTLYKTSGKTSSHKQDTPSSGSTGMAWRDYSETNYAYDGYDEKAYAGNGNTMPLRATPAHLQPNYHYNGQGGATHSHITNLSLPRPQSQSRSAGVGPRHHLHNNHLGGHPGAPNGHSSSNGGHGGTSTAAISQNNPDFYFMPSQRKYSGEVVRVYVDHNNKR